MNIDIIIWLFPVVFMIHEFEEIITFKWWLNKNNDYFNYKFGEYGKSFSELLNPVSTSQFALLTAILFIIISILCFVVEIFSFPNLFGGMIFAIFFIVSLHLILSLVLFKYIPGTVTALLTGIYCIYAFLYFQANELIIIRFASLWSLAFLFLIILIVFLFVKFRKLMKFD